MSVQFSEAKLTDDLERTLIQREIDGNASAGAIDAGVFALEILVGAVLLLGALVLAVRFG